uniref:Uncharacterized protein n=1 Tax=Anopheles christyi TaxID=43041 RepID=A0A182KI01_9DIPT
MKQFDIVTLVGGIQPQRYLIDTQEYLHRPGPITATPAVDNIFRPGTALDADSRFRCRWAAHRHLRKTRAASRKFCLA